MACFQITLTEMEEIVVEWEPSWRKDVPIEDIVKSEPEEEEEEETKKDEEEDDDDGHTDEDADKEDTGKKVTKVVIKNPMARQT